jgi:TRAP-type uncharacterized transport system substrate-binding protein
MAVRAKRLLKLSGLFLPVALALVGAVLLVRWWFEVPRRVRIVAADERSVYYQFAEHLKAAVQRRGLVHSMEIDTGTSGSVQNARELRDGRAHLGLIQDGAFSAATTPATHGTSAQEDVKLGEDVLILAPVFPEVVHVLVRRPTSRGGGEDAANGASDQPAAPPALTGRRLRKLLLSDDAVLYRGSTGFSGMQKSAAAILRHYAIHESIRDGGQLVENAFWDEMQPEGDSGGDLSEEKPSVAILTTSITNQRLRAVLQKTDYEFLSLETDALSIIHPYFHAYVIPKGAYGHRSDGRAIPEQDVQTVATTAFLAVPPDADSRFVTELMAALYEEGLRTKQPDLIPRDQVATYLHLPFHAAARAYFEPYDFGPLASMVETLSGSKEIIFAMGAGVYLLWSLRRRRRERIREVEFGAQIARLDEFLDQAIALEAAQMDTRDPEQLRQILDDATQLKLDALDELTDKDLRGDQRFSIFLMQCTSLIDKIQLKIITYGSRPSQEAESPEA